MYKIYEPGWFHLLKLTALCNAGVLIEYQGASILIDGVGTDFQGFTGLASDLFQRILQNVDSLTGVIFTHTHPDHYDPIRANVLKDLRPECRFFVPNENTAASGCIQCGPFSVCYFETPHMPQDFEPVRHFVLLVLVGAHSIYFAADAILEPELHHRVLGNAHPEYVFVNPVYLSMEPTRQLLHDLDPGRVFVYHIPEDPTEQNGIRRKAERCAARWQSTLPPVTLIDRYPMRFIL